MGPLRRVGSSRAGTTRRRASACRAKHAPAVVAADASVLSKAQAGYAPSERSQRSPSAAWPPAGQLTPSRSAVVASAADQLCRPHKQRPLPSRESARLGATPASCERLLLLHWVLAVDRIAASGLPGPAAGDEQVSGKSSSALLPESRRSPSEACPPAHGRGQARSSRGQLPAAQALRP